MKSTLFERFYGSRLIGNLWRRDNTDIAYSCFERLCKELRVSSSTLHTGYAVQPDFKNKTIDIIIYKVNDDNPFSVDTLYNLKGEYYCIFSLDINNKVFVKENKTDVNLEKKLKNNYATFQSMIISLARPTNYQRLFDWFKKYETEKIIRLYAGSNIIKFIFKDFICVENNGKLKFDEQVNNISYISRDVDYNNEKYDVDVDENGMLFYKHDDIEFQIGMTTNEEFYLIYQDVMYKFKKIEK